MHFFTRIHLFTTVAGQVKRKNREKRYSHTGDDDVHRVKERLPSHRDVKRNVQVGFVTAGVKLLVPAKREHAGDTAVNSWIDQRVTGRITAIKLKKI